MSEEQDLVLPIVTKNNRTHLSLINEYGKQEPSTTLMIAVSGHGKGLSEEFLVQEFKKIHPKSHIFVISDPKGEAEFSFFQLMPRERYHLEMLKKLGIQPETFKCKLWHPYSHLIPTKTFLPDINFYTIPIKSLCREDFSILSETAFDSESNRLLMRVSEELKKNDGLFMFLHEIQRRVQGKKSNKKAMADPKNFYLSVGGGTSKSVTEVANLLSPFKKNYFLRKDSCPYALDMKKIYEDTENIHVFLAMWLKDEKLEQFTTLHLLKKIIEFREYAKYPVLVVFPEVLKCCPRNAMGYKMFLSDAIAEALVTMRSQGRGMSAILDAQSYSDLNERVLKAVKTLLLGQLSAKDQEVVVKSLNYKREIREKLQNMDRNAYFKYGKESFDPFVLYPSRSMHKESSYNWIDEYNRNPELSKTMKRYDELVKYMKKEYEEEEQEIRDRVEKEVEAEIEEEERKREEKEARKQGKEPETKKIEKLEKKSEDLDLMKMRRIYELKQSGLSNRKIAEHEDIKLSHPMIPKWLERYEKVLEEQKVQEEKRLAEKKEFESNPENFKQFKGDGVTEEEFNGNFDTEESEEERPKVNNFGEEFNLEEDRKYAQVEPDEEGVLFKNIPDRKHVSMIDTEFPDLEPEETEEQPEEAEEEYQEPIQDEESD